MRVLLIGCGAVSEILYQPSLSYLQTTGLLVVTALVDPSEARLGALGGAFPRARRFTDLERAFDDARYDLAIVASPPRFHREQTLLSFEHGSHVLCEKPLATTASECDDMIAAANARGLVFAVSLWRRFYPSAHALRSIIREGVLGKPVSFAAREGVVFSWPLQSSPSDNSGFLGGVLSDIGPHALDLLMWWLGPLHLDSYADDALGQVEANCRLELTTASGVKGTLHLSRDTALPPRFMITCERGWVTHSGDEATRLEWGWTGMPYAATIQLGQPVGGHPLWAQWGGAAPLAEGHTTYFTALLRNVDATIRGKATLVGSAADAREGIRLINECYADRSIASESWYSHEEQERLQQLARRPE